MSDLLDKLEEVWPPERVVVECDTCGTEIYDSRKDTTLRSMSKVVESYINTLSQNHKNKSGHSSVTVDITANRETGTKHDVDINTNIK